MCESFDKISAAGCAWVSEASRDTQSAVDIVSLLSLDLLFLLLFLIYIREAALGCD